jgi:hypothetical protein
LRIIEPTTNRGCGNAHDGTSCFASHFRCRGGVLVATPGPRQLDGVGAWACRIHPECSAWTKWEKQLEQGDPPEGDEEAVIVPALPCGCESWVDVLAVLLGLGGFWQICRVREYMHVT